MKNHLSKVITPKTAKFFQVHTWSGVTTFRDDHTKMTITWAQNTIRYSVESFLDQILIITHLSRVITPKTAKFFQVHTWSSVPIFQEHHPKMTIIWALHTIRYPVKIFWVHIVMKNHLSKVFTPKIAKFFKVHTWSSVTTFWDGHTKMTITWAQNTIRYLVKIFFSPNFDDKSLKQSYYTKNC